MVEDTEEPTRDLRPAEYRFGVDADRAGERVDLALAELCGLPRAQISRWIAEGRVRIGDAAAKRPSQRVRAGDILRADPPEIVEATVLPEDIELHVLHEDEDLIVIDKAAGMVVHPAAGHASGTLVNALLHHCGDLAGVGGVLRPGIVHRLDRGTSGVMVAAKNDATHQALSIQFHDHSIERIYRTAVRALPLVNQGRVDSPIGRHPRDRKRMSVRSRSGRPAATRWRVLERFAKSRAAWLEIYPESGRTHQIRVHLASVGLPISGDPVYGRGRRASRAGVAALDRPALHAAVLGFVHPGSGEKMRFEAPLHADILEFLASLRVLEAE